MPVDLAFSDLVDYTEWQRQTWYAWLQQHRNAALNASAGPQGDGRFTSVGDLVKHIFSAEQRYVERLWGQPLSDTASIPSGDVEALFQFGRRSREQFRALLDSFPLQQWDEPRDFQIGTYSLSATPRKIVVHVLMHEIRHWAQIGTLLRLNGLKAELQDFLFSPVLSPNRG